MPKSLVFCEGSNDATYFDHYSNYYLSIKSIIVDRFEISRLSTQSSDDVLVTGCGGVPNIYDVPILLMRQLVGRATTPGFFIVADSDIVSMNTLRKRLETYLGTKCKRHNFFLNVEQRDDSNLILQETKTERIIKVKLFLVPGSLETRIAEAFCSKYSFNNLSDPHLVIAEITSKYYNKNKEAAIQDSVSILTSERWMAEFREAFTNFLASLS